VSRSIELTEARLRYARIIEMVALHVGSTGFAERVVVKAVAKEELYTRIVREAWRKRRVKRWLKKLA
jgi:hypothetical protein